MTEESNKCLCHSFGPLCKACKAEPCTRCKQFTTTDAANLGRAAFLNGEPSAPAQSEDFMAFLAANVTGEIGFSLPFLKAFSGAWQFAHREATKDLLKELKASRVSYANHRRTGSQGYGFNVK